MLFTIMKLLKSRKTNADVGKQQHMLYVVGVLASIALFSVPYQNQ